MFVLVSPVLLIMCTHIITVSLPARSLPPFTPPSVNVRSTPGLVAGALYRAPPLSRRCSSVLLAFASVLLSLVGLVMWLLWLLSVPALRLLRSASSRRWLLASRRAASRSRVSPLSFPPSRGRRDAWIFLVLCGFA